MSFVAFEVMHLPRKTSSLVLVLHWYKCPPIRHNSILPRRSSHQSLFACREKPEQQSAPKFQSMEQFIDQPRLPKFAVPKRYDLRLKPDLTACKFSGSVSIDLDIVGHTNYIVLNAAELSVDPGSVSFTNRNVSKVSCSLQFSVWLLWKFGRLRNNGSHQLQPFWFKPFLCNQAHCRLCWMNTILGSWWSLQQLIWLKPMRFWFWSSLRHSSLGPGFWVSCLKELWTRKWRGSIEGSV